MLAFRIHRLHPRVLLPLLVLLIAGCGVPSLPTTTRAVTSQAPGIPSATPHSSTAPQRIKITTTNAPDPQNPAEIARHTELLTAFKTLRPDVEVEARQGGFDKVSFLARLEQNTMEDAYLVPFTEPQDFIARGYAADISALITSWDNYYSFNPSVLEIVKDNKGAIYGVPVGSYAMGLLYNRKLFVQAGLDPDQPPATWDELRSYARLIKTKTGKAGFAELSTGNQGGWHFTTLVYSFGGDLQRQTDDVWRATFNEPSAVQALQLIKAMRWDDQSLPEQSGLDVKAVLDLMAREEVAMAVMAPDALPALKAQFGATIEDFGLAPLPQSGGNTTLVGGSAWLFNPKSSPEVIKAAFEWTINRDFNLSALETDLKGQHEQGALIGWPQFPLFGGEFQRQRDEIIAKYANAPVENYTPYENSTLQLKPEPPIETQKMYALLDTAMEAVLSDANTDPQQLLNDLAQQFQRDALDQQRPAR